MALVVKNALKETVKKHDMRTSGDFIDALDKEVECLVVKAVGRAKANKRQTVTAKDV